MLLFRLDFITLFAAFGAFQGLLFAVILWFRKGSLLSNRLFSLLLLATSIRIAKNIVVHIREIDPDLEMSLQTWRLLVNIGLSHQFAIGPLFVLYFLSRTQAKFSIKRHWVWHFLPFAGLLITSPWQSWPFWRDYALLASYISILGYYLWAVWIFRRSIKHLEQLNGSRWLRDLLLITGLLLLVYSPALFKYVGYIGGAVLDSVGLYGLSMILLQQNRFFSYFQSKYPGAQVSGEKSNKLLQLLKQKLEKEAVYLDPELSLSKLAGEMEVSVNILSQLINSHYKQNFSDYINGFRIEHAKKLLGDPKHERDKIATIAFESGFNSLSRFNTVFKKVVGVPPSAYKKAQIDRKQ